MHIGHQTICAGIGGFLLAAALGGCARVGSDSAGLSIATPWPESECTAIEREFQRWLADGGGEEKGTIRLLWTRLAPGDDLARVVTNRSTPIDLVLGGPAASYRRLAHDGRLVPGEGNDAAPWYVARRAAIGLAMRPGPAAADDRDLTFDDPRRDPVSLAWAQGRLRESSWAEGYARLVREAGHPRRIGWQPGSALAAVERGEASASPCPEPREPAPNGTLTFAPMKEKSEWIEGVAILQGGHHQDRARTFLHFLATRGQAERPPEEHATPAADDLLADLLGATLVDAQEELWSAWRALGRPGSSALAERWMTEAPPWPPASVQLLLDGNRSGELLETLVGQVAPDADVRAWLMRSWLAPARQINGPLLEELAEAVDGRLAAEPRFRAWLRAEWTAWARQRYRRVMRVAEGRWP